METKMILQNDSLWNRIQEFSLDAPNVDFPFSKKLAKEENWTLDFTQKAIEEYKKFVYLCCILPNGASPSEIVDKVWHMHLIYTQNYWEEFCPNILKRKLHHYPSKGGQKENVKHKNWFQETVENYKEIFQQDIPKEIWLNEKKEMRKKGWLRNFKLFFSAALILLILTSCSEASGFSTLITIVLIGSVIFFVFGLIDSMVPDENNISDLNKKGKQDSDSGGGCGGSGGSCSGGGGCGGGCGGCGGCGG